MFVVWLGKERKNSDIALNSLEMLSTKIEVSWSEQTIKPTSREFSEAHWAYGTVDLPFTKLEWNSINDLLGRAWLNDFGYGKRSAWRIRIPLCSAALARFSGRPFAAPFTASRPRDLRVISLNTVSLLLSSPIYVITRIIGHSFILSDKLDYPNARIQRTEFMHCFR
jgi:hypothetical protein